MIVEFSAVRLDCCLEIQTNISVLNFELGEVVNLHHKS